MGKENFMNNLHNLKSSCKQKTEGMEYFLKEHVTSKYGHA